MATFSDRKNSASQPDPWLTPNISAESAVSAHHGDLPSAVPPPGDGLSHPCQDWELSALLSAGTSLFGTLSFSGRIRIEGDFSGQLIGGDAVVIAGEAKVQGEIRARQVLVLGGSVKADIFASEAIELYLPAQVTGDLQAPEIHMDSGFRFAGTCDLSCPTDSLAERAAPASRSGGSASSPDEPKRLMKHS